MKKILLMGAGRSSVYLIDYLLENGNNKWELTVADVSEEASLKKIGNRRNGSALVLDVNNSDALHLAVGNSDIVISLLPPSLHIQVARACLYLGKHLVTASYVSSEIKALDQEAKDKGLIFLNECGLDPGIDHMSAMKVIDAIKKEGGIITEFKSYCGGLVAREAIDNPFGYKFSWNPKNVVLAGQATATYLKHGRPKFIPYQRIFSDTELVEIPGGEKFDAYANRDSISYIQTYSIPEVKTMLRGTLRYPGFCKLWNFFVQSGLTDVNFFPNKNISTYRELIESLRPTNGQFLDCLSSSENQELETLIATTGLWENKELLPVGGNVSEMLQYLLEKSWVMNPGDTDRVVMQHVFSFSVHGNHKTLLSTLDITGQDSFHTAMAKTVGLPLAMATKLILEDEIKTRGVCIPISEDFYQPILKELEWYGVQFKETSLQ